LKIQFAYSLFNCPWYLNLSFGFLISFGFLRTRFFWFWHSLFLALRFETLQRLVLCFLSYELWKFRFACANLAFKPERWADKDYC